MVGFSIIQKEITISLNTLKSLEKLLFPIPIKTLQGELFEIFIDRQGGNGGNHMKLPIVIHKDPESDFSVTVPDLPGCFSAGSTLEEAIVMAQESSECHVEGLILDGDPIPIVSPLEEHQKNSDYADGIWALIDLDLSKLSVKSKRVNITIPERLLNAVDKYAKKHGESRSGLLSQAVTEYMTSHH